MQKIEPVACHLPRVTRTSTLIPLPDLLIGMGSSVSPSGFLLLESFTRSLGRDDGARMRMEPTTFKERGLQSTPAISLIHKLFPLQAPRLPTLMQSILAESLSAGGETLNLRVKLRGQLALGETRQELAWGEPPA